MAALLKMMQLANYTQQIFCISRYIYNDLKDLYLESLLNLQY